MRLRALRAGWACLTALGVACAFAAPAATTTGCTTHQCDSDFVNIDQSTGTTVGDVQMLGSGTALWESSPYDGTWIDFPGQRTYFFNLPPGFEVIQPPVAMVSTGPNPNEPDATDNSVLATGQLAEVGHVAFGGFTITNGTCQEYWLYVSVLGRFAVEDAGVGD